VKERFKRELTVQAAHQDLLALSEWEQNTNRTDRIGCLISSILGIGVLTAMTIFMISSGAGVSFAFLLLIAVFVWGLVCSCKPVKRQAVDPEKIRLIRDTVVSGRVEYDDDNSYFLSFRELGELEVPRREDEHLRLRLRPGYATTKIGDAFLVAVHPPLDEDGKQLLAFYSMDQWRLPGITPEQIAQEIREEEALIARLIACQRFPKPELRKEHFERSKDLYWVRPEKPDQDRNLIERFAATYFLGDILSALEFVIRYCPPDLQKEAEAEYTPRQKKLSALLRDLQKSDDTRKKHRESVNKVIHIFRRERDE